MQVKKSTLLWSGGLMLAVLLVLNGPWLWKNIQYAFHRNRAAIQQPAGQAPAIASLPANTLSIPSLDITAPVQEAKQKNETAFQAALKNGVVHYPGTAGPGEYGNDYIFGHSSDFIVSQGHYKTIFATLPRITPGTELFLSNGEGKTFRYRATKTAIAQPNEVAYLDQQGYRKRILTVQTSYPVGTALRRFLVIAELDPASQVQDAPTRIYRSPDPGYSLAYPESWKEDATAVKEPDHKTTFFNPGTLSYISVATDSRTIKKIQADLKKMKLPNPDIVTLGGQNAMQYEFPDGHYEWFVVWSNRVFHASSSFNNSDVRHAVFSLAFQ